MRERQQAAGESGDICAVERQIDAARRDHQMASRQQHTFAVAHAGLDAHNTTTSPTRAESVA